MEKGTEYAKELEKLTQIFADTEESKKKLVEGLISDAAFLYAENIGLKNQMEAEGMVRIHPTIPSRQKPTEAGKQYLKNVNSYAVIIKTLNSILSKTAPEEEDAFDKWLTEKQSEAAARDG